MGAPGFRLTLGHLAGGHGSERQSASAWDSRSVSAGRKIPPTPQSKCQYSSNNNKITSPTFVVPVSSMASLKGTSRHTPALQNPVAR